MSEKIISETFTSELGKRYKEAWKETENSCDVFCCATADYTTDRNLDLSSGLVFCEEKTGGTKIKRKEYRLQAYLIKKALNNGKYLQIGNKKWLLLDAERTFAGNDIKAANNNSIKAQGRKRLDILIRRRNKYISNLELKAAETIYTRKPQKSSMSIAERSKNISMMPTIMFIEKQEKMYAAILFCLAKNTSMMINGALLNMT